MDRIELNVGGKDFVFSVRIEDDCDASAPWDECDGHGPVSDWEWRDKRPGELILCSDRHAKRFYDYQTACAMALRDGWDCAPYNDGSESKRQQAAKAARADFEFLRRFCDGHWGYVGVIVTLLDNDGEETSISDSLWGIESDSDHIREQARLMAEEIACGYGVSWGESTKTTFDYYRKGV